MIELLDRSENGVVGIRISGKVTEADYDQILPELERKIAEHGEIGLLCHFDGWTGIEPDAIWRDISFFSRHFRNVRRFAIVSDRPWQGTLARVAGPLTGAETRAFGPAEEEDAWRWLFRGAEADRAWTDGDAGRRHARKHRKRLHELVRDLRQDSERLDDLQAKLLFETSAEVLTALERSLSRYDRKAEAAPKAEEEEEKRASAEEEGGGSSADP